MQQSRGGHRSNAGRKPSGHAAKDRVITALSDGPGTILELASELDLCVETIRSALRVLKVAGVVQGMGVVYEAERGRPPCRYALTGLGA